MFNEDHIDPSVGAPCALQLGDWTIDPARRLVQRRGQPSGTVISPKAMALFLALAAAAPRPVSRMALMDRVWPDLIVGDESLTHAVSELRRALGQRGRSGPVETIQKGGYRLTVSPEPEVPVARPGPRPRPHRADDYRIVDAQLAVAEARRLRERNGNRALDEAFRLCREAIAMAPDYVPALAEYAMAAADCALFSPRVRPDMSAAREVAERATRLRPDLAAGHMAQGMLLDAEGATQASAAAFGRALSIDPADATCHYLMARMFYAAGDMVRAAHLAAEAGRLHETGYCAPYLAAGAFLGLGNHDRAAAEARRAIERIDRRRRIDPLEARTDNIMGAAFARLGQHEAALTEIARYEAAGGQVTYYNAVAFAAAGEVPLALDRLEQNIDTGFRNFRWIAHDPALASLRSERRLARMLRAAA